MPRPPQGQPVVAALAHSTIPFEFAARSADVVFVTPPDTAGVDRWVDDVRAAERTVDRTGAPLKLFADLVVFLDDDRAAAERRKEHLDDARRARVPLRRGDLRRHAGANSPTSCWSGRRTASTGSGSAPA